MGKDDQGWPLGIIIFAFDVPGSVLQMQVGSSPKLRKNCAAVLQSSWN